MPGNNYDAMWKLKPADVTVKNRRSAIEAEIKRIAIALRRCAHVVGAAIVLVIRLSEGREAQA